MNSTGKTSTEKTLETEIAEVKIHVEYIRKTVDSLVSTIKSEYLTKTIFEARMEAIEDRIKPVEDRNVWITRIIIGAVITAVLTLVLKI